MLTRHHHDLTYLEYATPTLGNNAPLLVMLHGYGSNEKDLISLAPMLPDGLRIVSVRAPLTLAPEMNAWFSLEFLADGIRVDEAEARAACERFLLFLRDLILRYQPVRGKVFIMGFSQVSVMSYITDFLEPDLLHGVIACSGQLPEKNMPSESAFPLLRTIPFVVLHGIYDDILPIEKGRHAHEWLQQQVDDLIYREYPIAHQIADDGIALISSWLTERLEKVGNSRL